MKKSQKKKDESTTEDFEKLGVFYLGRPYDLETKQAKPGWLLYDSKDLVTHAVCVGMTGSGKTGLCINLLEEAAIDGIPALIIDPKGDLSNLLLTFPKLRGEDFQPWVNEDDARKKGLSPTEYASQQAELWKKGLASWGQDGARIQRLRDATDFVIYTPGSNAGTPVSILKAFAVPPSEVLEDVELLRELISTIVSGLLGLVGVEADPVKSPPHILISSILESVWNKGKNLDLELLLQEIQTPPFDRLGALDLEAFYPSQDPTGRDNPSKGRFSLAKRLNNLIASPKFEIWTQGDALDIEAFLYTPQGRPQISIFSIAHLNDSERMFFVTLLLSQTLGWMRRQSGTTSLRAILYMDEIFGYFPPVANPPSKQPLLTLLKQARAYGLGVVLATQNPVDLDYKGLANTGTWFIGRLQTERDKARVLEGLEGAVASAGKKFSRPEMEQILAGLGNRIFLMNNVHEDSPVALETRWCLSYLRGPLTRSQIKKLTEPRQATLREPSVRQGLVAGDESKQRLVGVGEALRVTDHASRPVLPPDIPQCFIPLRGSQPAGSELVYQPVLLGSAQVRITDPKSGVDVTEQRVFLVPIKDSPVPIDWDKASTMNVVTDDLEKTPRDQARYCALPSGVGTKKKFDSWSKEFASWIYQTHKIELLRSPSLCDVSKPGESERDFRVRLAQKIHEQRDWASEKLRQKYASRMIALQERLRRAEQAKEREEEEAKAQHIQTAISIGSTLLGAFLGRKTISSSTLGRASTSARGVGRSIKGAKDVAYAEENVEASRQQLQSLNVQFEAEMKELVQARDPLTERLQPISLRPTKANVAVKLVALAWAPHWRDEKGGLTAAWD
jgi:hypothetical protein